MHNKTPPQIEYLRVQNYRALRDLELKNINPLTAFLGPNGSGKSTILDVFAFLSECFTNGLRDAWNERDRFAELRSRGEDGPINIKIKYRERPNTQIFTYFLSIDENSKGPYVLEEWLEGQAASRPKPFRILDFRKGKGFVFSGSSPLEQSINNSRDEETLDSVDILAASTFGLLGKYPRVSSLRRFITGWYLSNLSADSTRGATKTGPQEHLSVTGDNLPNVIQYLKKQYPKRLAQILNILTRRIPRLENIDTLEFNDGRLLLRVKDAPFDQPILAEYVSDGTLKMLSYLMVLHDPDPPQLIGIEEPENYLHPRLLQELAEECRQATSRTQLMVTTHSPFFVNGLRPEEVWVLYRNERGFTQVQRTADIPGVKEFVNEGSLLGYLWMEGHFRVGDPYKANGKLIQSALIP
jgi:predicted ATPase